MKIIEHVSALVFNAAKTHILLVMQSTKSAQAHQENAAEIFWSLPGGKVQNGHSRRKTLLEEVWQETGQRLTGRCTPLYRSVKYEPECEFKRLVLSGRVQPGIKLTHLHDPDGDILDADWIPERDARQFLGQIADDAHKEPLLYYLQGGRRYRDWGYRQDDHGHVERLFPLILR